MQSTQQTQRRQRPERVPRELGYSSRGLKAQATEMAPLTLALQAGGGSRDFASTAHFSQMMDWVHSQSNTRC